MSEMIAYLALFKEQALHETRDVTFKGNPLIPDDSYGLLEFYCPDPDCDCNMVMIGVMSKRLMKQVASMVYYFDPKDVPPGMTNPDLDLAPQVSFAKNLLKWFTAHLKEDPAYVERLKKHYCQVKDAASNPSHPAHQQFQEWLSFMNTNDLLQEDEPQKPTKKKFTAEKKSPAVPKSMQAQYEGITLQTDRFCQQYLNEEYRDLCQKMAAALARKRPSPLSSGYLDEWAAGIVYAIGKVNFVFDKTQTPHINRKDISAGFNVKSSTASHKANLIQKIFNIGVMDPKWYLPSKLGENPIAWQLTLNGFPIDARYAPREIQEEAFRKGLIPYIPETPARKNNIT